MIDLEMALLVVLGAPVVTASVLVMGAAINRFLNGSSLSSVMTTRSQRDVSNK